LQRIFIGGLQVHARCAAPSPRASHWNECFGVVLAEIVLIFRREFNHSVSPIRIAKCGEDLSSDAEIRMVHVLSLFGFGQRERELAEGSGGHVKDPLLGYLSTNLPNIFS